MFIYLIVGFVGWLFLFIAFGVCCWLRINVVVMYSCFTWKCLDCCVVCVCCSFDFEFVLGLF